MPSASFLGPLSPTSSKAPLSRLRSRVSGWVESLLAVGLTGVLVASWATHILACVASGLWGFLALGLLVFPVAVVHGLVVLGTAWL